jgi:hypothetical protein
MRNQVLWTENLEKARETTQFPVIDVSREISVHFNDSIDDLLADPAGTIKKLLNTQATPTAKGLILTNIGILLEPELQVSVVKLLLDYAVSLELVLFWPFSIKNGRILAWDINDTTYSIEFNDHILQHLEIDV